MTAHYRTVAVNGTRIFYREECASSNCVLPVLQKAGFKAACAPLPLTSLSDDVRALDQREVHSGEMPRITYRFFNKQQRKEKLYANIYVRKIAATKDKRR